MGIKNVIDLIPLIQGELVDSRYEIHEIIVKRVLSKKQKNDIINIDELKEEILDEFNFGDFPDELLYKILDNLVSVDYLRFHNNDYELINIVEYKNIDFVINECYKEFVDFFKAEYKNFDPFIHKNFKVSFEECLYVIVGVFSEQEDFYNNQIEALNQNLIENDLIKIANNNGINSPKQFVSVFFNYLNSGTEKITDFIYISYRVAITYDLLRKGSILSQKSCDIGKGGILILDTNSIISLICRTDSRHKLITSTIQLSQKLKCDVCYTEKTKLEYNRLLKGADGQMRSNRFAKGKYIADNQLINDFVRQKGGMWGDYYAEISDIELYLRLKYEINLAEYDNLIQDEKFSEYIKGIYPSVLQLLQKERQKDAIEHDIYLFSLSIHLRNNEPNMVFNCPWILSFDNALNFVNKLLVERFELPYGYVLHPRYWLDTLLTFSNIQLDEANKKDIVNAILCHMIIPEKMTLNLDQYAKLISNKLGLTEENEELIKRIITISPLKRNLDLALESNNAEGVSKITSEIFIDSDLIDKVISEGKIKEENVKLKDQLKKASEKYRIEKAKNYLLEEVVTRKFAEPKIIIDNVDPNISKMIEVLMDRLELIDHQFFEQNQIQKLESGRISKENAISTLKNIAKILRQGKDFAQEIKDLTQYVPTIIGLLNS